MPLSCNIIARTNGVGLDRDADLIQQVLNSAGHEVTFSHCRSASPLMRWLPQKKRFDVNIFLERVFPRWLGAAHQNVLIPNQERFPKRHLSLLKKIDHIFCKSQHALEIFQSVHPSCHFTGFTSLDLHDPETPRKPSGILHLAGRSTLKGTDLILDLWEKHPEWPMLTLVQCKENAPDRVPENVNLMTDYLEDREIIRIYNEHPIHLCPSLSEGWGHYLVEAMSCGALVLTTDGPPMNEIIHADRGILIETDHSEPRHLGTNFYVNSSALETAIEQALSMTTESRRSIQETAMVWAKDNHTTFTKHFTKTLRDVFKKGSTG